MQPISAQQFGKNILYPPQPGKVHCWTCPTVIDLEHPPAGGFCTRPVEPTFTGPGWAALQVCCAGCFARFNGNPPKLSTPLFEIGPDQEDA